MAQNETAKVTIYLDDKQAEAAIDALKQKSKELKVQLDEARKAGDNIKMKKLESEIRNVDAASRSLLKDSFDVERVLKNINKVSWRDLEKAQKSVVSEMKRMERGTEAYAAKEKNLAKITAELNKTRGVMKQKESMWGSLANGANKYFNMITLGIATLTGVVFSMAQFIKGMVGLDDALADVMKTTGLTRKEVRELYQDFKYLNTRTPRAELLKLAEEAGRLGKTGKKDIMDFVEVANKIKISLGDDLGKDVELAVRDVGKLTEIFRVGQQYNTDYKTSMEKIGSGLNTVANNSNASAEYLIEYMKRLGGISTQAKITAADIMGYASTFDQLGQNVEMAATAQSKVVVDMFTDPGKYAKIAKMEVGAFSQLLKTDANEAFIKFLEGLNGNNEGLSTMATKLDGLGIDGARAIQALAVLSSNTKMLREQQVLANDAMTKGVSLNNEYAIKNNNLAGSWAKLTTFIKAQFINSDLLGFLENVIGKLSKMTEVIHPLTKAMNQEVAEVNILTSELLNANVPAERRNVIYNELKRIAPDVVANIDAENISLSTLRGNLEKYNEVMIKKLALQDSEETLADKRESAGKATSDRIEKEIRLRKDLFSILAQSKLLDPDKTKDIESVLMAEGDIIYKYQKIQAVLADRSFSYLTKGEKFTKAVITAREDEKTATDDVTKSLEGYMQRYEMVFGIKKVVPTPPPLPGSNNPNKIPLTEEELKAEKAKREKAKDDAYKALEIANRKELNLVKQHQIEVNATEEDYNKLLEEEEINALNKKLALQIKFGDDYSDTMAAILDKQLKTQEDIDKKTEDEKKKSLKKELDDLANQQKNELALLKKDALAKGLSEEETNALLITKELEFLNAKLILQQKYGQDTVETTAAITAKINELAENAVKGDEDRTKELADLKKKYLDEEVLAKEERVNDLARLDELYQSGAISSYEEYQRLKSEINKKYEQGRLQKSIEFGQKASQIISLGANLVSALMESELASAGDNEEKKLQIRKKYANAQFLVSAAQIVVATAVAIMQGFAQLGPIGGAIAAVILGATGVVQLGIANKERQKMLGSKQSGGYADDDGPDNQPAGIYHKNEFIASAPAVRNPTVKPILDVIDMAQRSGTIRSLNLSALIPAGKQSGGYGSPSSRSGVGSPVIIPGTGSGMSDAQLVKLNAILDRLESKDFSIAIETYERERKRWEKTTIGGLK